jgi:hypothetical protein
MEEKILKELVEEGCSQREISSRLETSQTNVRWWMKKFGLRTKGRGRNYSGKCAWHLCTNTVNGLKFCSKKCKNNYYVDRRRKQLKEKAVQYLGGKCIMCGYSECIQALATHHLDPSTKDFNISHKGYTRSWEKVKAELDKCVLLCCRCHIEVHSGFAPLPSLPI